MHRSQAVVLSIGVPAYLLFFGTWIWGFEESMLKDVGGIFELLGLATVAIGLHLIPGS